MLASCGGGDTAPDEAGRAAGAPARAQALALKKSLIPADAGTKGMWSSVYSWPLIPIHALLMPDGRVLTYGSDGAGKQTGYFIYDLWDGGSDPASGHLTLPNQTTTDIFCSAQVLLTGTASSVFIAGGDNWTGTSTTNVGSASTDVFSGTDNTLTRGATMNRPRWYATTTTLLNGEVYIQGGRGGGDRAEIRGTDGSFRLLPFDTGALVADYPRNFIVPDGRIFGVDGNGAMYYVDVGAQTLSRVGQLDAAYRGIDSTTVMYRPGRLLQFGGASNAATTIDVTGVSPVVTPTASLSSQRRRVTGTLLADGKVLATGGSTVDQSMTGVNYTAEIWDPQSGQWTVGSAGAQARLYHSTALLLPDATVLVGGGGAPGPQTNLNVEIYYPPYLFTADGREAPRPAILSAPNTFEIGKIFPVQVDNPTSVRRVVLLKTGSVTHSVNMDQRFIELGYTADANGLRVQAPAHATEATPGYYMLFVIDAQGVPSKAVFLYTGVAAQADPGTAPALQAIADRYEVIGNAVDFGAVASDPNGDPLTYSATGLPPGLSLNAATGRITGTLAQVGDFSVVLGVSDGVNTTSASFLWHVTSQVPLVLGTATASAPVAANNAATFTASATGTGVVYKWNFGDGSAETPWSASTGASHGYAQPGVYFATVTAQDGNGAQQTRTVLQAVYLPPTAKKPAASGMLATDLSPTNTLRVWVVNQDNKSISVIDAVSGVKVKEIPVGWSPRSIAIAPDGRVWVANRGDATVSIVNRSTLAVTNTLALPRASQPFGIAMSPTRKEAYIALEAGGQVLRYATDTLAKTGALNVGLNVRHLSVSADGTKLLATRFITPPLPGEATAAVTPTPATGGEVLSINPITMTLTKTIVLQYSNRTDGETQGRGIPNYLGPAVISPDGTQAWVPSKQDNVLRGGLRDGLPLTFENTVRAVSSRIDMAAQQEDAAARIDHDNSGVASGATFDASGVYLFVALETTRQVAVVDAHTRRELFRFDTGFAPQGLALSADGATLLVNNFMSRTVGIFDLLPLVRDGQPNVRLVASPPAIDAEYVMSVTAVRGKQLFYDARDPRLARDGYLSCAACHNEGAQDGRVWDLSSLGEGLRNTIGLRGKGGAQGFRHWSANFDETQDFEGQIRTLAGGSGLMSDAAYNTGTRSSPLGDKKAGVSADLDALAAYVSSLTTTAPSPYRTGTGALSADGTRGQALFVANNCASCHAGTSFTASGSFNPVNIGTIKPTSGNRLGGPLNGIDIPTLRDLWATAPYLHDGSAATLQDAVRAHGGIALAAADVDSLASYLRELGSEEATAPIAAGSGVGLAGAYYAGMTLAGSPVLTRTEQVAFVWGAGSPGPGVPADKFSARWTGSVSAPSTGVYRFQVVADDGVKLWINNVPVVTRWTNASAVNATGEFTLQAGQPVPVKIEYYENTGNATIRLQWLAPGNTAYVDIPKDRLSPS